MVIRHKFGAVATEYGGKRYPSKKEANYAAGLHLRQRAGEIIGWLEQVPFYLQGGVIYKLDFLEFHSNGTVHFVETKGVRTKEFNIKMKMMAEAYPWVEIEVV